MEEKGWQSPIFYHLIWKATVSIAAYHEFDESRATHIDTHEHIYKDLYSH
jgi:hypothetical protein